MKPPSTAEVNETSTSTYWLHEGILYVIGKRGKELPLEEQKKQTEDFKKKLNGQKICAVMDVTNSTPSSKEAREYSAKQLPEMFKAIAFVAKNPVGRMMANLYLTFKPFSFTTKVFGDEEEAIKWIRQFM